MTTENTENTEKENDLQCELAAWELLREARAERDEAREHAALARKLERERDEAREELSRLYHWVERRSQDGFIDSQTHEQNITRCYDALYDRLDAAERALMEIEDRCVDGEDACDDIQKIRDIAVKALVAGQ